MQTHINTSIGDSQKISEADRILRNCVHCGFCTATCPTYQLLGDELDSPRGRIYLIKQMLEGNEVSEKTQTHLDRCLTCRSCETTCPSGVQYGRLVDIGREFVEQRVARSPAQLVVRKALRAIIPYPKRFAALLMLGSIVKPFLPAALKQKMPEVNLSMGRPTAQHARKILLVEGCAQSVVTPNTNDATARVLDKLGIQLIVAAKAGCCGAVSQHLSAEEEAKDFMRRNIDAWWPHLEQGAEAILSTASGCGVMIKDYGHLLANDAAYADKAKRVSALTKDISEVLRDETFTTKATKSPYKNTQTTGIKVAFHSPCTLQHGQKLGNIVEQLLTRAGYELSQVSDPHLCCGSAGTYSVLQAELSQQLLANKLTSLQQGKPDVIASANIGCQMHLATKAGVPVKHWIELIDEVLESKV